MMNFPDFELTLAYGSIILMALIPIYVGSFLSLKVIAVNESLRFHLTVPSEVPLI
jgi:hypothetical protein